MKYDYDVMILHGSLISSLRPENEGIDFQEGSILKDVWNLTHS